MRRRTALVVAGMVLTSALGLMRGVPATTPTSAPWEGTATMVSGTSRYDAGEWIHTDFVYDDTGADTSPGGQPNIVSLAPASGDFRYPEDPAFAGNAADIVEVRVREGDRADAEVRVVLQTVVDAATVALWVDVGGAERIVHAGNAAVDAATNTVTFTVPGALARDELRLNIGAGLRDGDGLRQGSAGSAYTDGDTFTTGAETDARLFDLAFNTRDLEPRGGAWNEDAQSDAIAAGDVSAFAQTIDVAALRSGRTTPVVAQPGYSVHLFESRQELGEGIGESFPQYLGRWQPYAVWVPAGYDPSEPAPLFLNLHSLSVHHNQYRGGTSPTYTTFYEQTGDALGAVVVTPLGRGPDGWYHDEALIDTLEVWADALRRFSIDRERVWVGGYSMGGYGTYRLSTLMPDAFAAAVSIVGPPADGVWAYPLPPSGGEDAPGNTRPQLENTRHVPTWITHGAEDELVPVSGIVHHAQRFAELGHEYRFALHPVADHLSFTVSDEWSREAAWMAAHPRRVVRPDRVTLKVRPATWAGTEAAPAVLPALHALVDEVGARLDGAYWVDDVAVAGGGDSTAFVDLSSGGIARKRAGQSDVATAGVDGPSPYVLTGLDVTSADGPVTDTLSGRIAGAQSVTVDVGRAGLSNAPTVDVVSDRPVTITLVRDGTVVGRATTKVEPATEG